MSKHSCMRCYGDRTKCAKDVLCSQDLTTTSSWWTGNGKPQAICLLHLMQKVTCATRCYTLFTLVLHPHVLLHVVHHHCTSCKAVPRKPPYCVSSIILQLLYPVMCSKLHRHRTCKYIQLACGLSTGSCGGCACLSSLLRYWVASNHIAVSDDIASTACPTGNKHTFYLLCQMQHAMSSHSTAPCKIHT